MIPAVALRSIPLWTAAAAFFFLFPRSFQQNVFDLSSRPAAEDGMFKRIQGGEALLHGLPVSGPALASDMLLAPLIQAVLYNHTPAPLSVWVSMLAWAAPALLAFQLASALCRRAFAGLAGMVPVLFLVIDGAEVSETQIYVPLVLLVAALTAWRARAPTPWRGAILGAGIGMSLLSRSPLFLFPVLLTAYEMSLGAGKPRLRRLKDNAWLLLIPALFLAPRTLANWRLYGRLIPFEDHRAENNVVTGAMGLVPASYGDYLRLAAVPQETGVYRWAAQEILRHPVRYAGGVLGRIGWAFELHPALFSLGLLSIGLCWKREDHRQVGLLALYFIAAYCSMAVVPRYFDPLWPILAALIPACAARRAAPDEGEPRMTLAWLYFLPLLLISLASQLLIGRYPSRSARGDEAFDLSLARDPADAWLWYLRGARRLEEGKAAQAAEDLSAAVALKPGLPRFEFAHVWALAASGRATAFRLDRIRGPRRSGDEAFLLRMLWSLRQGKPAEAARSYADARRSQASHPPLLDRRDNELEREAERRLGRIDKDSLSGHLLKLLKPWPEKERLVLLRRFKRIASLPSLLLEEADVAGRLGERAAALGALRRAHALGLDPEDRERAASLYNALGEYGPGMALLESSIKDPSRRLAALIDLSGRAARTKHREAALKALRRAEESGPDADRRRELSRAYAALGEDGRALALLRGVARERPGELSLWLDLAGLAQRTRNRMEVLDALARAEALRPGVAQRRGIAALYSSLGENARALAILDDLLKTRTDERAAAGQLNDRGVLEAMMGRSEAASADLREAIRLDARPLSPYVTLGGLLLSSGKTEEARKLYDAALARSPSPEDEAIWRIIKSDRATMNKEKP